MVLWNFFRLGYGRYKRTSFHGDYFMVYKPTYNWAPSCMVVWLVQTLFKFSKFPNFCWRFETWWWTMSFSSATTSDRGLSSSCYVFLSRRTSSNFALRASPSFATRDAWWGRCGPALATNPTNPSAVLRCWGVEVLSFFSDTPNSWSDQSQSISPSFYMFLLSSTFGCMRQIQVTPQKFE